MDYDELAHWTRIGFERGSAMRRGGAVKAASVRVVSGPQEVTSIRQAAAVCNVTPPVVRRWLSLGLISGPPWTVQQLHQIRDRTDSQSRRRGPQVAHGTMTRWNEGCSCTRCRQAQNDARGPASDGERRSDSRPRCGSNSWMRSMRGSCSAACFAI
jgi:hypothetical protein